MLDHLELSQGVYNLICFEYLNKVYKFETYRLSILVIGFKSIVYNFSKVWYVCKLMSCVFFTHSCLGIVKFIGIRI